MESPDRITTTEKKIQSLEQDLNDLKQGLTLVSDYYQDLERISRQQDAVIAVDEIIAKPHMEDDIEFESIWRFHEDVLVPDPDAHIPVATMYEAFVRYCEKNGRNAIDQESFTFVFAHMENPAPVLDQGKWTGYLLRPGSC
jgi:phage/plasmid-associated DNA primase